MLGASLGACDDRVVLSRLWEGKHSDRDLRALRPCLDALGTATRSLGTKDRTSVSARPTAGTRCCVRKHLHASVRHSDDWHASVPPRPGLRYQKREFFWCR